MSSQTDAEPLIDKGMYCLKLFDFPLYKEMLKHLRENSLITWHLMLFSSIDVVYFRQSQNAA